MNIFLVLSIPPVIIAFLIAVSEAKRNREERTISSSIYLRMAMLGLSGVLLTAFFFEIEIQGAAFIGFILTTSLVAAVQIFSRLLTDSGFADAIDKIMSRPLLAWHELFRGLLFKEPDAAEQLEQELLDGVEEFSETVVREVMVPRIDLHSIDADESLEVALSEFLASGHSRLPVVGESLDDIVGILFLKDVARVAHQDPGKLHQMIASEVSRPAIFVPETKLAGELLREMQRTATQLVMVSDEYGGISGLATMEDLIEELVGEISDEHDREEDEFEKLGDNLFRVNPRLNIFDLADLLEVTIEEEEVDTVSGLLTKELGRLATGGERVSAHGLEFIAERVDVKRGRILAILVKKVPIEQ